MATKKTKDSVPVRLMKVDPALPFTEIEIEGRTYKACFTYEALAKAETLLMARGHFEANLLYRLPHLTFDNVRVIFACSLVAYQPELEFEAARRLITAANLFEIASKMIEAWKQSMPEPEKEGNPPEPGA